MLEVAFPVLVMVIVWELFFPATTVPKLKLVGEMEKPVVLACGLPPTIPAHPLRRSKGRRARSQRTFLSNQTAASASIVDR